MPHFPQQLKRRRFRVSMWGTAVLVAGIVSGLSSSAKVAADDWTNLEGTKTFQGDFLGMWGDKVILRGTNGKKVAIETSKLNAASRLHAEELAAIKAERRQSRIGELKTETDVATAIPTVKPAAPFEPPAAGMDLSATVEYAMTQLQSGNPRVFWELLPPSYQSDLQEIVRLQFQSTDPQEWASSLRLVSQLARTLNKQREFVFGYPALSMVPPDATSLLQNAYMPAVGILSAIGDPELLTVENLTTMELGEIIAKKNDEMGPHIAALLKLIPEEQNPMMAILAGGPSAVQMDGSDRGSMSFTDPAGQLVNTYFVTVEGRWVPESMAQNWQASMAEVRKQLAIQAEQRATSGADSTMIVLAVGGALTEIEDAATQEEFNAIIDRYVELARNLMPRNLGPAMAGGGGNSASPSGFNPPNLGSVDSGGGLSGGGLIPGPGSMPSSGGSSGPPGIAPAGVSSGGG